jgi:hypothetical protein
VGPASGNDIQLQLERNFGYNHQDIIFKKEKFETKQRLTHQVINFTFFRAESADIKDIPGFLWVTWEGLKQYPFPKTLQEYISSK